MSKIKHRDTKSELRIKDEMEREGFEYQSDLPGKPDFINFRKKTAAFVGGCFWHSCPKCFVRPSTRTDFWMNKIKRNAIRDAEINKAYEIAGWKVIRIWEHELNGRSQ